MSSAPIPAAASDATCCPCCSFCSKGREAVAKLFAGPGVYICDCCVEAAGRIITGASTASMVPPLAERSDEEILRSLASIQGVVAQVDGALHGYVDALRQRGVTWTRIGEALGVSKQAAWERFSGEE